MRKKILLWIGIVVVAAVAFYAYYAIKNMKDYDPDKFAWGNGRLEATEINIAAKLAGRVDQIYVEEGDLVQPGQKLARMQTNVLAAELEQAQAKKMQAVASERGAQANIKVREAELAAAKSTVAQAESRFEGAKVRLERAKQMDLNSAISKQKLDDDKTNFLVTQAELDAAKAQLQQAEASVDSAKAELAGATAAIAAAAADVDRIQADIDDSLLVSPREGRIQYKIAQVGEVLSAGGKVLNLADLTDVYMTFFLPERIAGKVAIGADVKLVIDAASHVQIPAKVIYVASVAQFTPKTVETESEREKMMFRIKARIDAALLKKYIEYVKTGLPGVAWVRLDPAAEWPSFLSGGNRPPKQ